MNISSRSHSAHRFEQHFNLPPRETLKRSHTITNINRSTTLQNNSYEAHLELVN